MRKMILRLSWICVVAFHVATAVDKPWTLKIPMTAPIGGNIIALGPVCTEGINLALNAINNHSQILPDYRVVVDLADDQCQGTVALRNTLPFLFSNKGEVPNDQVLGDMILPSPSPKNSSYLVPPLIISGFCTDVCKTTSKLTAQFNYIDIHAGCLDPSLSNRKLYPNFYRYFPSLSESSVVKLKLIEFMSWKKIAILSDTVQSSYQDAVNFMNLVQKSLPYVKTMEDFFYTDATDSIKRIKAAGFRIIFIFCYANTCPSLGCAAYREGLYGPRVVYVLNVGVDMISANLKETTGCEDWMVAAVREHALFVGPDAYDTFLPKTQSTDSGVTLEMFERLMAVKAPFLEKMAANSWRMMCFEIVHIAARIMHSVELKLKQSNETLKSVLADENRIVEVRERVRESLSSPLGSSLWGHIGFQPNTTEPISPPIVILQVQRTVLVGCFLSLDRTIKDSRNAFQMVHSLEWSTPNGAAPRSEPIAMTRVKKVSSSGVLTTMAISAFLIVLMWAVVGVNLKECDHVVPMKQNLINKACPTISAVGITFNLVAVFLYPVDTKIQSMDTFCATAAVLVHLGSTLMTSPLIVRLVLANNNQMTTLNIPSQLFKQILLLIGIWLSVNAGLLIGWYSSGLRPVVVEIRSTFYDGYNDVLWMESTFSCTVGEASAFLDTILVIHGVLLVIGVAAAVRSSRHSRLVQTGMSIYVTATLFLLCIFVFATFRETVGGVYAATITYAYTNAINVIFVLHFRVVRLPLVAAGILQPESTGRPMVLVGNAAGRIRRRNRHIQVDIKARLRA